jgi:hypothetical protein
MDENTYLSPSRAERAGVEAGESVAALIVWPQFVSRLTQC